MPIGTGVETLANIPSQPFVADPGLFMAMTRRNVLSPAQREWTEPGGFHSIQLLQAGVVSKLQLTFVGELVVSTAAVTTSDEWPYKLLSGFNLSANGQNNLFSVDGVDLHALRFVRYPAYDEQVDVFPGSVGGGDSVAVGTHDLHLTFDVPISMDEVTLIGSLYAQSSATNLTLRLGQALMAELFSANPGNAAISGTWYLQETLFEIPFDSEGRIVVPDLSVLHGFNAVDAPFTNTGEVRIPLIRSAGQLARLFVSARKGDNLRLSAAPNATDANKIDRLRLEYGGNQRPLDFNPASNLLSINNHHYAAPAPYDRLVLDQVRENPVRDAINMQGVTELAVVPTVNTAATITAGRVRVVQEILF